MIVQTTGFGQLYLHFKHTQSRLDVATRRVFYRATGCVIRRTDHLGEVLSYGIATCHDNDQFCKATGRKLSLARALKKAGFTKTTRAEVWSAYFAQVRHV